MQLTHWQVRMTLLDIQNARTEIEMLSLEYRQVKLLLSNIQILNQSSRIPSLLAAIKQLVNSREGVLILYSDLV